MAKIVLNKTAFVRHPVLPELKRKLNSEGFQIIDAAFAPAGEPIINGSEPDGESTADQGGAPLKVGKGPGGKFYVKQGKVNIKGPFSTETEAEAAMVTPDGVPTPIPEAWEAMPDEELEKLAGELAGEPVTELNGQTPAERAKSIIQAAVDDRAGKVKTE